MGKWAYTDRILYLKPYKTEHKAHISESRQTKDLKEQYKQVIFHSTRDV